jgi:hypothetical protein
MPAPKGNTNASRPGYAALIRVRVPSEEDFRLISEKFTTAERGEILLEALKSYPYNLRLANPLPADSR